MSFEQTRVESGSLERGPDGNRQYNTQPAHGIGDAAEQNTRLLKKDAAIYTALLAVALVVVIVAFSPGNWLALVAGTLTYAVAMYAIVTLKTRYELRTYSEIVAFCNGVSLGEIKEKRETEPRSTCIMKTVAVGGCAVSSSALLRACWCSCYHE